MYKEFLTKLLTKEAQAKAIELIRQQPKAQTEAEGHANHQRVVDGVYAFVEDLDDRVALIPYAGPFLAQLVDSPPVDQAEYRACEFVVEQAYQLLAQADALATK